MVWACPVVTFAYGQDWLELGSINFIYSISMKNKRTHIFSFFFFFFFFFFFSCPDFPFRAFPLFRLTLVGI